ncbi:MAG TPA: type II toxin-antitoxin system PemK/MazF family toxin [Candidatus Dormibacteraeota bacterium]|nr:type II toxin-antitoxin system PemK/MazF family toxin [Candidatus Dormibacteraeota bacterium]
MTARPGRGEIWLTDFGVPIGHEVGYPRPAVIISNDRLNRVGAVAIVVPMTSQKRQLPTHVRVAGQHGTGLSRETWAKVDDVKSVSTERLEERLGEIDRVTLGRIEEALRLILEL